MARIDYVELPSVTAHELTRGILCQGVRLELHRLRPGLCGDDERRCRCRPQRPAGRSLAAPLPVIRVDDLEAAFDAVMKAGGIIAKPIFAFPGGRRFHFIDPSGSELPSGSSAIDSPSGRSSHRKPDRMS